MLISIDDVNLDDDHWIYSFTREVITRLDVPEETFCWIDICSNHDMECGRILDVDIEDSSYYIVINGRVDLSLDDTLVKEDGSVVMELRDFMATIAHELKHLEQLHHRRWEHRSIFEPCFWLGKEVDRESKDQPWEDEAYAFEAEISDIIGKYWRILENETDPLSVDGITGGR